MTKIDYWAIMTRRKQFSEQETVESKLGRVFGTFDLTALGVSATLGVGVYVLAGHVAKDQAGPSVILSFLIAAVASFLAGLCYAEFSSRVPKSGSAYIFTYVAIGEFLAFIVGWNLILEYVIGAASISKGLSLYIDSLLGDAMKNSFKEIAPISWDFLSPYFDFFSFGCPLFIGSALAFGLKKSAGINNVFCVLNLGVVAYVVVAVLFNADIQNWKIDPATVPSQYANSTGVGGFFPFGFSGTLKGAATCFFGFVGFDCIATTGEEVHNPQKTVPRALLFSLLVIFVAYFGVSLLTLMWPYYLLDAEAPLPHAFLEIGWYTSMWVVTIGGILGLLASLFGAMFPLPRILYAMAQDGLIFRLFGVVSDRFQTPVVGTLCAALLTSCFSSLFDLAALVNMLSIGVLLAYTVVAISIIILRFSQSMESKQNEQRYIETSNLLRPGYNVTAKGFVMQLIRLNVSRQPNTISMWVVGSLTICYCLASFVLGFTILYSWDALANGETWALVASLLLVGLLVVFCILIAIQPRQKFPSHTKPFKVPLVPFLPLISVFINIYLMLMLDYYTWIRFAVWMVIGLIVYFPSAWLYNGKTNLTEHDTSAAIAATHVEDEQVKDVNLESGRRNNEVAAMKRTCETENVIIVHENLHSRSTSGTEGVINNKLSVENEANLAIEMLDTVLEAEEENDSLESEINGRRVSSQSIKSKDANVPVITLTPDDSTEKSPPDLGELEIIDRDEVEAEIIEILRRAAAQVNEIHEAKSKEIQSDDEKNVFNNRKFLIRLNDLISKSNQQTDKVLQSKTLERKSDAVKAESLKHSKSAPNFNLLLDEVKNQNFHDDTSVDYVLSEDEDEHSFVIPPPPAFSAELFEKVATLRRGRLSKEDEEDDVKPLDVATAVDDDVKSLDDKSVNKEDFRDKLEKLLSAPPTRLSLIAPTPLPRTSLLNSNGKPSDDKPSPREAATPLPITGTMRKQRELFDEVLKKIKHDGGEEVSSTRD